MNMMNKNKQNLENKVNSNLINSIKNIKKISKHILLYSIMMTSSFLGCITQNTNQKKDINNKTTIINKIDNLKQKHNENYNKNINKNNKDINEDNKQEIFIERRIKKIKLNDYQKYNTLMNNKNINKIIKQKLLGKKYIQNQNSFLIGIEYISSCKKNRHDLKELFKKYGDFSIKNNILDITFDFKKSFDKYNRQLFIEYMKNIDDLVDSYQEKEFEKKTGIDLVGGIKDISPDIINHINKSINIFGGIEKINKGEHNKLKGIFIVGENNLEIYKKLIKDYGVHGETLISPDKNILVYDRSKTYGKEMMMRTIVHEMMHINHLLNNTDDLIRRWEKLPVIYDKKKISHKKIFSSYNPFGTSTWNKSIMNNDDRKILTYIEKKSMFRPLRKYNIYKQIVPRFGFVKAYSTTSEKEDIATTVEFAYSVVNDLDYKWNNLGLHFKPKEFVICAYLNNTLNSIYKKMDILKDNNLITSKFYNSFRQKCDSMIKSEKTILDKIIK